MSLYASRPPHPGRTAAERKILDAIGCGDVLPRMHPKVRDRLLDAGLIVQCGTRTLGRGWSAVTLPEYSMSVLTHMQWCSAVAATDEEMDAFAAASSPEAA